MTRNKNHFTDALATLASMKSISKEKNGMRTVAHSENLMVNLSL